MDKSALFRKFVAFTTEVHQITSEMTKDVKSEAVTLVQYKILEYITVVAQPVTPSEISYCMHMSMPNTSRELKKLIEKQLCRKVADSVDRRKQYIRLTEKGEAMMNEAFQRVQARFVQSIEDISDEELKEIEQALDLLHSKLFLKNRTI